MATGRRLGERAWARPTLRRQAPRILAAAPSADGQAHGVPRLAALEGTLKRNGREALPMGAGATSGWCMGQPGGQIAEGLPSGSAARGGSDAEQATPKRKGKART